MDSIQALKKELLKLLEGKGAHAGFEQAVKDFPAELRGVRPAAGHEVAPHSAWELLEHLRIAQWDMLEFSRNARHQSPEWPKGYWPAQAAPPHAEAWDESITTFRSDAAAMAALVGDPASDLFTPFPWGDGQTLLREALQLADHNAYHIGEIVFLRRLLGAWG